MLLSLPLTVVYFLSGILCITYTDGRDAVHGQSQRDGDVGRAMYEVCGSVDGVEDEGRVCGQRIALFVCFFAHEAECWV